MNARVSGLRAARVRTMHHPTMRPTHPMRMIRCGPRRDVEYTKLARGLWTLMSSPDFKVDTMLAEVPDARAFYDGQHGLRMIVVTQRYWGEAWIRSPTVRRASIHTAFLERGIVLEYDSALQELHIVKNENWSEELLDTLRDISGKSIG